MTIGGSDRPRTVQYVCSRCRESGHAAADCPRAGNAPHVVADASHATVQPGGGNAHSLSPSSTVRSSDDDGAGAPGGIRDGGAGLGAAAAAAALEPGEVRGSRDLAERLHARLLSIGGAVRGSEFGAWCPRDQVPGSRKSGRLRGLAEGFPDLFSFISVRRCA